MVLRLSQVKALAVKEARTDDLVVAADTVVVLDGSVMGKPIDAEDATRMLRLLRGRSHVVYSGVSLWHAARRRMVCQLAESLVWMRDYTDAEIATYVDSGDPLDKAGAYAIQHPEFDPVSWVDGCWLGVVGLPLCHLSRALAQFGVVIPANVPGACQAFGQHECAISADILGTIS
jgi:MAF protein